MAKLARRAFLFGSAAIAGGVAFGWFKYRQPHENPLKADATQGQATLNPYVLIDADGVTLIAPRAEMGQGVHTTLAALVAEEMDLDWAQVRVIHGPAAAAYYNTAVLAEGVPFAPTDLGVLAETTRAALDIPAHFLGIQITGGSSSVADAFEKMRVAGASARATLVQVAANRLALDPAALKTAGGAVIAPDGTRLPYAELAVEAAALAPVLADPKPQSGWQLLGKSLPRVDMLAKVTGTATFTADLRLPGMRFGTVRMNPRLGGEKLGYDASALIDLPDIDIVELQGGCAVLASTTWQAFQAADAIVFDWGAAPYPATSDLLKQALATAFDEDHLDAVKRDEGDVGAVSMGFEASYSTPYLAHATMEPMTATALFSGGQLTVWAGTQIPTEARRIAAEAAGIAVDAVTVETMLMGGGFGRRLEMDAIHHAATVAKARPDVPVLLTFTREEDMTHDMYRPAAMARVRGAVDAGRLVALDFATCSSSVIEGQAGRLGYSVPGPDGAIVQGAWEQPYDFANHRVTGYRAPAMVPVGSWRSVGASQNGFFYDTALDELAHLAGADPLEFRLQHMTHDPSRKVLETVARLSDWGKTAAGRAKGVAFCLSFGVPVAEVIEVENTAAGLRLTGAWIAADVGTALDPRNIEAQLTGGLIFGLSAAIRGEITFDDGMAQQVNFWDYEPLRINQIPPIRVEILQNLGRIRGIGEPAVPPAAPALGNAIFALTGQRLRDLPFNRSVEFA